MSASTLSPAHVGAPNLPPGRRADLDWIRVAAFGLLIFYHVGMAFVTWDWHVKTAHPSPTLEPLMVFTNPWRLSLLFFVSGCATRYMAARLTPGALARLRVTRLLPPLIFGMLVVVPPQSWVQVREHGYTLGFWPFYARYLQADHHFCDAHGCLTLPTWNHLWFVAYLLVYTLILLAALAASPRALDRLGAWIAPALRGPGVLLLPAGWLILTRMTLGPHFEETHDLVHDWYAHSVYAPVFLLGYAVAARPHFWAAAVRYRWLALGVALATYAAWGTYVWAYEGDAEPTETLRAIMRPIYGLDQWAWIVAILGFGHRHITRGGAVLDYLTQGVFPFYIAHQTIIVVTEYYLKPAGLPAGAEAAILVAVTAAGCGVTYEVVRRVAWLRPLFGLRPGLANPSVAVSVPMRASPDRA